MVAASAIGPDDVSEEAGEELLSAFEAILVSELELEVFVLSFEEQPVISTATERTAIRFLIFINTCYKNQLQSVDFKNNFVKSC